MSFQMKLVKKQDLLKTLLKIQKRFFHFSVILKDQNCVFLDLNAILCSLRSFFTYLRFVPFKTANIKASMNVLAYMLHHFSINKEK